MLRDCLTHLARDRDDAMTAIVVDNSDPDRTDTEDVVAEFEWCQYLRVAPCANFQTHTRNRGADATESDIIAFLDDDSMVQPGWLQACRDGYASDDIGAVGGQILDPEVENLDHHREALIYQILPNGAVTDNCDCVRDAPVEVQHLRGCNYSVRRSAFEMAGRFDEKLAGYGYEDLDLLTRIRKQGHRVIYHTPMAVYHALAPRTGRSEFDWTRFKGVITNLSYVYARNFGLFSMLYLRFFFTYRTGLAAFLRKPTPANARRVWSGFWGKVQGAGWGRKVRRFKG